MGCTKATITSALYLLPTLFHAVLAVLKGGEKRHPFLAACENGMRVGLPQSRNGSSSNNAKSLTPAQASRLYGLRENILTQLQEYSDIINDVVGKPRDAVGDIVQATIVAGCPFVDEDGEVVVNSDLGNAIIEIISSGQPIDAALTAVFVKIDGIDGESGGGGGGSSGGGSGGCHDEDAGVCCDGPCPC